MSSTDKERSLIKEWAVKSDSRIEGFDVDKESFWSECESSGDVIEYDFQNVPELKKVFGETLIGCEDVMLPLTVATFKMKDRAEGETNSFGSRDKDEFSIPEFIYVF